MRVLSISDNLDVDYYRALISMLEDLKESLLESAILDLHSSREDDRVLFEEIVEKSNCCLDRFFLDTGNYFQIEGTYDLDGLNRAASYFTFSIDVYKKAIEDAKVNFHISGF